MKNIDKKEWCEPNHGVSHFGEPKDGYWATISDYGTFVDLDKWFPGCKFSPLKETFDSLEEAKTAGELWANQLLEKK